MSEESNKTATSAFPDLPYLPPDPQNYRPEIGLIGCGGITHYHLQVYRQLGYRVTALCDIDRKAAQRRRDEFFPTAELFTDYRQLLQCNAIEVVDIATHPEVRAPMIADTLRAGKHVLSQKPFVLDLEEGRRLADLADQQGVYLAVNQNGRWAPHWSTMREAVRAGLIGEVVGVHTGVHWDHGWVRGTAFEQVRHLILYDFAIHWFDFLSTVMGGQRAERVYASATRSTSQQISPPLIAQAVVEYPHAQASLVFDADVPSGSWDQTLVSGSAGILRSAGENSDHQQLEIITREGSIAPKLCGQWNRDGFHGTMGELLCAIEQKRQPMHSGRNNLASLELCFAAVASSVRHEPVVPGTVGKLIDGGPLP